MDALIATKQTVKYDQAVKLLRDLQDLHFWKGTTNEIEARVLQLQEAHAKKPSFLARLEKAGLTVKA